MDEVVVDVETSGLAAAVAHGRRTALRAVVGALLATRLARAEAQALLRIVVPYPAGGATDKLARLFAEWLGGERGATVIVDNRPGAGGTLGTAWFAENAEPGKALLLGTVSTLAIAPAHKVLAYAARNAFAPVGLIGIAPLYLVVGPSAEATTAKEFIALARTARPSLSYASVGENTLPHLAAAEFCRRAGLSMLHVPYAGSSHALVDLLAGRIDMMVDQLATFGIDHLRAGKLRVLAVFAPEHQHALPAVPTMAEAAGEAIEMSYWVGLLAPKVTTEPQVAALADELKRWLARTETHALLRYFGIEPRPSSPAQFAQWIDAERSAWRQRASGHGEPKR